MLNSNSSAALPQTTQRPARHFRLAGRLTALILIITVPLMVGVNIFVATQAGSLIEDQANAGLHDATERTEDSLLTWLKLNGQAVAELATLPGMASMDPVQQKPILVAMAKANPDFFLVHTLNLSGFNVTRNDNAKLLDYHDRDWFIQAKNGTPLSSQVVISKTIGKPVLAIGAPIKDASGNIVGVVGGISKLDEISNAVGTEMVGKTGFVYVVDNKNQVVMHPDPTFTNGSTLVDLSSQEPVASMRKGVSGIINFNDDKGKQWRAYVVVLSNGWAVITQEPQDELLAPLHLFQAVAGATSAIGIVLLLVLAWLSIRQTLKPIGKLTEAADAIAAGDLERTADVSSQDEIGALGSAFNTMTAQLRDFIANLETRVKERTTELEQANEQNAGRSKQLHSIAEITRAVGAIRSLDEFLPEIAQQIGEWLSYPHVSIYLNDQSGEYVLLQAASSAAGKKLLARNHRVKIDQASVVGLVASTGQARIALADGEDAHFFGGNPELADMRSEIALPLRLGDNIIGVLDLQTNEPSAFTHQDIETLTLLADQVAIAIQNNQSFDETRVALAKSEEFYQQSAATGWRDFLHQGTTGYRFVNGRLEALNERKENAETSPAESGGEAPGLMSIPIVIRGKKLGNITIRQAGRSRPWDESEMRTLQAIVDRLSFALENARLFTDAQKRASKERVLGEISTKIRSSNDPNEMIRVAVDELKLALNISDVRIVPYDPQSNGDGHKEG